MLFKKTGILASLAISATLLAAPAASYANELIIVNNTGLVSSSMINNFICSGYIPDGTTPPDGREHVIGADRVAGMCAATPDSCTAVVYTGAYCDGEKVAQIVLSTTRGIVSAQQLGRFALNAPLYGNKVILG